MVRIPARLLALSSLCLPTLAAFAQDTTTNTGASAAGCLGGGIVWIISLAISIGLTIFVYTDAKKRGMDNPILWAILTFFTGLIGLIIYLLVRKK